MITYLSMTDIADWFGADRSAVVHWRDRHDDFPAADAVTGSGKRRAYGWLPEREPEIRAWHANRPPQGTRNDLKRDV